MPSHPWKARPSETTRHRPCAVCQRRKVKCNRVYPCAPCLKTGLECTFPPPQRRQKRLKRSNSDVDDAPNSALPSTSPALPQERILPSPAEVTNTARLVSDGGGYRYVNNHLWNALPARPSHSQSTSPATTSNLDGSTPRNSVNTPAQRSTQETSVQTGSDVVEGRSFVFGPPECLSKCHAALAKPHRPAVANIFSKA